ncbi:33408_t:CDS:2, partial [Gigaspora margarita]
MVKTFPGDIAKDFDKLYESKEGYDTIIIAGEEPNVEEIYAHSLILRTRSSYFRSALSDEWVKKTNDGYLVLKKPNIKDETILDLLAAADELLIQNLIDYIQEYLIEYSSDFIEQVPIKMLHLISHHEKFNELKETCLETICETPNFSMMDEDPKDEDIKNKGIDILEKILHELIKLIRFHQMDRKEFMDEVWPFRDLLPDKLIENVLRYYLEGADTLYNIFPIRWGNFEIDSGLINKNIALLFTKWINKETIDDNNSKEFQYNFNLLFRSSLDDPNNIKNATISRVIQDGIDCAIGCDNVHGPSFGEGPDLHVSNNSNTWKFIAKSYSKIGISGLHAISDYEVFQ